MVELFFLYLALVDFLLFIISIVFFFKQKKDYQLLLNFAQLNKPFFNLNKKIVFFYFTHEYNFSKLVTPPIPYF